MAEMLATYKYKGASFWGRAFNRATPTLRLGKAIQAMWGFKADNPNSPCSIQVVGKQVVVRSGLVEKAIPRSESLARSLKRVGLETVPIPEGVNTRSYLNALMNKSQFSGATYLGSHGISAEIRDTKGRPFRPIDIGEVCELFEGAKLSPSQILKAQEAFFRFLVDPNVGTLSSIYDYISIVSSSEKFKAIPSFYSQLTPAHFEILRIDEFEKWHYIYAKTNELPREELLSLLTKASLQILFSISHGRKTPAFVGERDAELAIKRAEAFALVWDSLSGQEIDLIAKANRDEAILIGLLDHRNMIRATTLHLCTSSEPAISEKAFSIIEPEINADEVALLVGKVTKPIINKLIQNPHISHNALVFYAMRKYRGAFDKAYPDLTYPELAELLGRYWKELELDQYIRTRIFEHPNANSRLIELGLTRAPKPATT